MICSASLTMILEFNAAHLWVYQELEFSKHVLVMNACLVALSACLSGSSSVLLYFPEINIAAE